MPGDKDTRRGKRSSETWRRLVIVPCLLLALRCAGQQLLYTSWDNYTVANGMPDEKVLCVAVDGERVWAGTRKGVVLIVKNRIMKIFTPEDGLAGGVVTGIAVDENTGDVWMATLGGLSRYSGGEFKNYTNLASGLANDLVYAVAVQKQYVWAATAAGISRFNTHTGEWSIYDDDRVPGHVAFADSIAVANGKIYFGLWGGGVLEYAIATERWKLHLRNNASNQSRAAESARGPLSNFITGVSYDGHTLWATSRFGVSRYDGSVWRHSAAPVLKSRSAAVNMARSNADGTWLCSEEGLVFLARNGASITYRAQGGHGSIVTSRLNARIALYEMRAALPDNELFDVAFNGQDLWVATARGLSHGTGACRTAACLPRLPRLPARTGTELEPDRDSLKDADTASGEAVNIGFFAPAGSRPGAIYGAAMLQGAELAIEEANAAGGFTGGNAGRKPFALKVHEDAPLWGAATGEIVKMVNDERVVAVLGTMDGASSHTILKVASILEVPVVNSGTGDPDITATGIPWILHNFPDDRMQAHALARYIVGDLGLKRIGMLEMRERDALRGADEFAREAQRLGATGILHADFRKGEQDFSGQLVQLANWRAEVIVFWGEPAEAAQVLKQMRNAGMGQAMLGPTRLADPMVIQTAGLAAEGLVVVSAMDPTCADPAWQEFQKNYRRRFNAAPDQYAAYGYDGAKLVIGAIEKAGLNRKRIRESLREYENSAYTGVSGSIHFDTTLNNISSLSMARVEGGKFVYWKKRDQIATSPCNSSH